MRIASGWESSLEAAGAFVATAHYLAKYHIRTPLGVLVGLGDGAVVIRALLSDQIPICLVSCIDRFKLQLLCGVRIELALEVGIFFLLPQFLGGVCYHQRKP